GPRPELLRPCVEPEPPGNPFGGAPGAIGIGLHLDHRDRAARKGTVGVKDGIAAVLPALIGKATLRPAMIFHEAVAVAVAMALDPAEGGLDVRPQPAQGFDIAGAV